MCDKCMCAYEKQSDKDMRATRRIAEKVIINVQDPRL
jgi:hypothetical protein